MVDMTREGVLVRVSVTVGLGAGLTCRFSVN
jgi:hypothetical protein